MGFMDPGQVARTPGYAWARHLSGMTMVVGYKNLSSINMSPQQLVLPLSLPPSLEMGDFIVSSSNEEALSWLGKWPQWPQNTLLIQGPAGCGKSHIASIWKRQAHLLTSKEITLQNLPALLEKSHFVLDDADQVAEEEALFHLLNAVRNGDGSLLLLSSLSPQEWPIALPDLRSRLNALLRVTIKSPDDVLMKGLIRKYFQDQQTILSEEVLTYLFHHLPRAYDALWTSLNKINEMAMGKKRAITIPLVKEAISG